MDDKTQDRADIGAMSRERDTRHVKAAVWTAYGGPDSFEMRELPRPVPGEDELLIRVRATTVTAGEVEIRRFAFRNILAIPLRLFFGLFRPRGNRVLGQELAGDVVEVGKNVTMFRPGQRVFAQTGFRFGGQAQFACQREKGMVVSIPDGVSYEEAATLPTAGQYALYFTRQHEIGPGMTVLVNGGAGSIGSYAIQIANAAGAEVTGVDRGDKASFMRELGAAHTIDYEIEDFTRMKDAYDLILDVIDKSSFPRSARALKPGGTYLHTNLSVTAALRRALHRSSADRTAKMVAPAAKRADLDLLVGKLESGELRTAIDGTYPLEEIIAAHRRAESGDKRGHIVLTVDGETSNG